MKSRKAVLTLISKILSHVASGQCRMGPKKGFTAAFDTGIKARTFRPLKGLSHEIDFKNVDEK